MGLRYLAFEGKSEALFKRNRLFKTDVAFSWIFRKGNPLKASFLVRFISSCFSIGLWIFTVHLRADFALGINFSGARDDFYGD